MLKKPEVEERVNRIMELVKSGQRVEDSDVELKATWLDPEKAAEKLCAHANSAGGQPILWIIGLDEKAGQVNDTNPEEMSDWLPKLESCFDERVCPELLFHFNVRDEGKTVTALYFATDRPPYVVVGNNRKRTMWRKGTMAYDAGRKQLLRLLVPQAKVPDVELMFACLKVRRAGSLDDRGNAVDRDEYEFSVDLWVTPTSRVTLPLHKCHLVVELMDRRTERRLWIPVVGVSFVGGDCSEWFAIHEPLKVRLNGRRVETNLDRVSLPLPGADSGKFLLSLRIAEAPDVPFGPSFHLPLTILDQAEREWKSHFLDGKPVDDQN